MTDTPERHYLLEARQILDAKDGEAMYLPERMHLVALNGYYQQRLIELANDVQLLKRKAMNI